MTSSQSNNRKKFVKAYITWTKRHLFNSVLVFW